MLCFYYYVSAQQTTSNLDYYSSTCTASGICRRVEEYKAFFILTG